MVRAVWEAACRLKRTRTTRQATQTQPALLAADAFAAALGALPADDWSRTWAAGRERPDLFLEVLLTRIQISGNICDQRRCIAKSNVVVITYSWQVPAAIEDACLHEAVSTV